jgi:hypothetical protein
MNEVYRCAHIHVQDLNNNWFVARVVNNTNQQYLFSQMKQLQDSYQSRRVKATDESGRVIDIL